MTLFFAPCSLLFATHILDLIFFQGHKTTHVFKTRIVSADWLGKCLLSTKKDALKPWSNLSSISVESLNPGYIIVNWLELAIFGLQINKLQASKSTVVINYYRLVNHYHPINMKFFSCKEEFWSFLSVRIVWMYIGGIKESQVFKTMLFECIERRKSAMSKSVLPISK